MIFIHPNTPKTHLRWNRFKKLISFLQVLWFWVDWRPSSGTFRPETLFFDQIRYPLRTGIPSTPQHIESQREGPHMAFSVDPVAASQLHKWH